MYTPLSNDDLESMTVPLWEQAKAALADGDVEWASQLIDQAVGRWRSLQDYSINWITSLLSYIGRELGEPAVEEALRDFGERFVRPRRAGLKDVNARTRMEGIVRAMKANGGEVELTEEDDRFVLSFRCGSGGMLIDERAYEPPKDYLVLRERGPRTLMRDELPVYCAHCSVNNEMQGIEWDGVPHTIEDPPTRPGERCVHHFYKDPSAIPEEIYRRVGKEKPTR
jgi:hypothetical protein